MFVHPILHRAYRHLEEPQSTERIMILFAFLVLLTHSLWLAEMLSVKQVNQNLQVWIPGYLTDRPQYIRMLGCLSDVVMGNTGTPRELYCQDFVGWRDRDRHCSIPAWGQCKRHCVVHQIVKHKLNKEPPGCMGEVVRVPLSQLISCLNQ